MTYQEPEELLRDLIYKAAFNLYAFDDSREEYQAYLGRENFNAALRSCFDNRRSPYFLSELMASPRLAFTEAAQYRKRAVEEAGKLLKTQQELAYRNVHWPLGHGFFLFMRWGASLPFQKGRALGSPHGAPPGRNGIATHCFCSATGCSEPTRWDGA